MDWAKTLGEFPNCIGSRPALSWRNPICSQTSRKPRAGYAERVPPRSTRHWNRKRSRLHGMILIVLFAPELFWREDAAIKLHSSREGRWRRSRLRVWLQSAGARARYRPEGGAARDVPSLACCGSAFFRSVSCLRMLSQRFLINI